MATSASIVMMQRILDFGMRTSLDYALTERHLAPLKPRWHHPKRGSCAAGLDRLEGGREWAYAQRMDLEITPVPSEAERAAIEAAVELLGVPERGVGRGAWWEAGVRENFEDEEGC
jgi:hypothetical protein